AVRRRAVAPEYAAADEAEDHRSERGDEAQRRVAAAIEEERALAREEVQEPRVEGPGEVAVLVPVGLESREEMSPVRRYADGRVVEVGRRQRVEDERRPVADEDGGERDPLVADGPEGEQEQKAVAEPDLGERVLEREVRLRLSHRAQPHAQEHEDERAPEGVGHELALGLARRAPARERERQGHADQEREGRLDEVVERAVGPLHVVLVMAEERPERGTDIAARGLAEAEHLAHQEQHDEAAVGVHRGDARRQRRDDGRRGRGGRRRRRGRGRALADGRHQNCGVTRSISTSCGPTLPLKLPVKEPTSAFFHRSRTVAFWPGARPMSSQATVSSAASVPRLKRITAREPSARGFIQTCCDPWSWTLRPCIRGGSWWIAMPSGFVRTSIVSFDIFWRSLPAMSGAAKSAQKLKWDRDSAGFSPPFPISSMSGSFQRPGPP